MQLQRDLIRLEVNYRGIFQKTLGKRIANDIVYIAHSEGKTAFSNGRYSDDPQRNGVPCANFAYFSTSLSEEDLEAEASAAMDIREAEVVVVVDDTMAKGVEPWGRYGIRPINEKVVQGGVILFVSRRKPQELVKELEKKPYRYNVAVLPGDASFSGLWYYRDDMTDVRVLGAISKLAPNIASLESVVNHVKRKYGSEDKVNAVRAAYDEVSVQEILPEEGVVWPYPKPELPGWNKFEEGVIVRGVQRGFKLGPRGQNRNPDYLRGTNRSQRPVVRFDTCTKCTLCWSVCPDEAFDPTEDGYYDVNYEYCTGCGRCSDICPVHDCIVMVDELRFSENSSPYLQYKKSPEQYVASVEEKKGKERIVPEHVTGKGNRVVRVEDPAPFKKVS